MHFTMFYMLAKCLTLEMNRFAMNIIGEFNKNESILGA